MNHEQNSSFVNAVLKEPSRPTSVVHVDALYKFHELVTKLGGDSAALLSKFRIDPAILVNQHAFIPYRSFIRLLDQAATELACPDFGMQLAAQQSYGPKEMGPLEIAMHNSCTVRAAFSYCAEHARIYRAATQLSIEGGCEEESAFVRCDTLIPTLAPYPHTIERGLLLLQRAALDLSSGRISPREIWVMHEPISPLAAYFENFGTSIRFGQSMNGVVFTSSDLDTPIFDSDPLLYELATNFIELHYSSSEPALRVRVRTVVERLLRAGSCTNGAVASQLGMHPRTLQRHLCAEGESFEAIKDGVRRDITLQYLKQSTIPLTRVAEILGYSETSVLSRSCYRWFSASPRQLRASAAELRAKRTSSESCSAAAGSVRHQTCTK
jgi:AraC-like DNA-binding protein